MVQAIGPGGEADLAGFADQVGQPGGRQLHGIAGVRQAVLAFDGFAHDRTELGLEHGEIQAKAEPGGRVGHGRRKRR